MAVSTKEIDIEKYLVAEIEGIGGTCLKLEVKGRNGWPDRLCLAPEGLHVFVEVKKRGGRLNAIQEARLEELLMLGQPNAVVWDKIGVDVLCIAISNAVEGRRRLKHLQTNGQRYKV